MENKFYHIGEISKLLGISQRTIRYYEELGFIAAERSQGGFRLFSEQQIEKLKNILKLKDLGLSLEEIKHLVEARHHGTLGKEAAAALLSALREKKSELEQKINTYNEGIKNLDEIIGVINGCAACEQETSKTECERCIDDRTAHNVPPLMKTLF